MARKPIVSTESICQRIFESEAGALTTAELGVPAARLNTLVERGFLALRSQTQRVLNDDGTPSRGRPRHQFGLSRKQRDKMRRAARKAAA